MQAREAGDYERALEVLNYCKESLGSVVSVKLCLELGTVLAHFGKWAEARDITKGT